MLLSHFVAHLPLLVTFRTLTFLATLSQARMRSTRLGMRFDLTLRHLSLRGCRQGVVPKVNQSTILFSLESSFRYLLPFHNLHTCALIFISFPKRNDDIAVAPV